MDFGSLPLCALVRECLDSGDADAWAGLIRRLQPVIARVVYRVSVEWGRAMHAEVDDIVQEIFLKAGGNGGKLLRKLPLGNEHATLAYFKVMAANSARDYFRARYAHKRGEQQTRQAETSAQELACALDLQTTVEKQILIAQIDAALPADPRDRNVFWLYYRQGFTAKEIAALSGFALTAKGVESLIHRLTIAVKAAFDSRDSQRPKGESAERAS